MTTKPNIGPHAGDIHNSLSFDEAFEFSSNNPDHEYATTGDETLFIAEARTGQKGAHAD